MEPCIVNVVIKYKLFGSINTSTLVKARNFTGYTLKKGKKTGRVYTNGIIIVTGVKTISEGDKLIREHFPNNPIITRAVKNMTACGKLLEGLSFSKILQWHSDNLSVSPFSYESEIFPAIYWTAEPETVYFFPSGAVILTGLKCLKRLDVIWKHLIRDIDKAVKRHINTETVACENNL